MKAEQLYHCFFCGGNFNQPLRPILGFATATACEDCQKNFRAEYNRTSLIVICEACERTGPELMCDDCGGRFHRECWEGHRCP
jgi:hypothetical protein